MTSAEALNILAHAATERVNDARASGQPLTADLLARNVNAAHDTLAKLLAPKPKAGAP